MNRCIAVLVVCWPVLGLRAAQAQVPEIHRFRPLASSSAGVGYSLEAVFRDAHTATPDSGSVAPTHWLEGGLIGAGLMGVVGAGTALGLSESPSLRDGLLGFVPGALIGFPLGALIGGQFPKRGH